MKNENSNSAAIEENVKNNSDINTATANTFSKKIGKSTYNVQVFFSKTSKQTFNDKLIRLVKNDVASGANQA